MKLFVNTKTQECGMDDPSDLDDANWIEAPSGTQAVYWSYIQDKPLFYKIKCNVLYVCDASNEWNISPFTPYTLINCMTMSNLWGTLQDFDL